MQKLCIFSSVQGVLLLGNEPLMGKKIIRTYKSSVSDIEKHDFSVTNQEGRFYFPEVYESVFTALRYTIMPKEPLVEQNITAHYNNKEYLIWQSFKKNFDLNGETDERVPLRLVADTTSPPTKKPNFYGIGTLH